MSNAQALYVLLFTKGYTIAQFAASIQDKPAAVRAYMVKTQVPAPVIMLRLRSFYGLQLEQWQPDPQWSPPLQLPTWSFHQPLPAGDAPEWINDGTYEPPDRVPDHVRHLRVRHGWRALLEWQESAQLANTELADLLGTDPMTVSAWRAGRRFPNKMDMQQLYLVSSGRVLGDSP